MNNSGNEKICQFSQGLLQIHQALDLSDLELFAYAWTNASQSERRQFVLNDGDSAMQDAFGISYLRVFTRIDCEAINKA